MMNKTASQLHDRVLALIQRGINIPCADDTFDALAREIFAFQYTQNAPYRAYCDQIGRRPDNVGHWTVIPAVPTTAFKHFPIACFPVEEAVAVFHTSGTTRQLTGKHWVKSLDLYNAALRPQFAAHVMANASRMPMLMLTPAPEAAPRSSLVHMLGEVAAAFSTTATFHDADLDGTLVRLQDLAQHGAPVAVLGTAFAFVKLFDWMHNNRTRLALPPGSRAVETGGFKGRSREVAKPALYAMFQDRLGIPPSRVVNEYGMTELSTQFYDQSVRVGQQTDRKSVPPWARVSVINPDTGLPVANGEHGLIRIVDLANLWSAACIQTEDIGVLFDDGFEIMGRAAGSEARGCSLMADQGGASP